MSHSSGTMSSYMLHFLCLLRGLSPLLIAPGNLLVGYLKPSLKTDDSVPALRVGEAGGDAACLLCPLSLHTDILMASSALPSSKVEMVVDRDLTPYKELQCTSSKRVSCPQVCILFIARIKSFKTEHAYVYVYIQIALNCQLSIF